jgi:hypothetical protein
MLSVVKLSIIMLSVVMLSVVILSALAQMVLLDFHNNYLNIIWCLLKNTPAYGLQLLLTYQIIYYMQCPGSAYLLSLCVYYDLNG